MTLYKEERARWPTFLPVTMPTDAAAVRSRYWDTENWMDKELEVTLWEVGESHAGGGGSCSLRAPLTVILFWVDDKPV